MDLENQLTDETELTLNKIIYGIDEIVVPLEIDYTLSKNNHLTTLKFSLVH